MKKRAAFIFAGLAVLGATAARGAEEAHWGYSGAGGPEHWGTLSAAYAMCGRGKNQSPIDLTGSIRADLKPLKFSYNTNAREILNNGHTVQANYTPGSSIAMDGQTFELKQLHFHSPSEHLIGGKSFPLEGHLVHADEDGNLAVVGVMFVEGKANAVIAALWKQMPAQAGGKADLTSRVYASGLLPRARTYYRYNGSLTTPPCSEGVMWLVMEEPLSVSRQQVEAFQKLMGHPNNRPVQPANARPLRKPMAR